MASNARELRSQLQIRLRRASKLSGPPPLSPQLPRITRLMALAVKLDSWLREQPGLTHAELARLGHVTASRLRQILNLLDLAPDIQERLLFLAPIRKGREPLTEPKLRRIALIWDWEQQRAAVERITALNVPTK